MWGVHDIGNDNLEAVVKNSESPDILLDLAALSRKHFGFFNKTLSRSVEYPHIVEMIGAIAGKQILDVGAGLSPLPIYLALHGATVVTVDNSATVRQPGCDRHAWNGWGFFDYGQLNDNIVSLNQDISNIEFSAEKFDCIYSVSVLEHISAESRRAMWARMSPWLKESGLLLLTLDIVPKTELLWNYCEGKVVEQSDLHGDIKAVREELAKEAFNLDNCKILRMAPESMTDIALLSFRKCSLPKVGVGAVNAHSK